MKAKEATKTIHKLDDAVAPVVPAPAIPELNFNEPILKKDIPADTNVQAVESREVTFDFNPNASRENTISVPVAEKRDENSNKNDQVVYDLYDHTVEDETDEQLRKARERVTKLKQLSYRIGNANVSDMEKEPAFKRRNIKLDSVPHSSESSVSRYTLSNEEDKKTELRQNNSFLHDNVD